MQFHVRVDPNLTVAEAHRIMDEVEAKLAIEFPDVEILIHPDPEGYNRWVLDQQSIKRRGTPEDIGNLVAFALARRVGGGRA